MNTGGSSLKIFSVLVASLEHATKITAVLDSEDEETAPLGFDIDPDAVPEVCKSGADNTGCGRLSTSGYFFSVGLVLVLGLVLALFLLLDLARKIALDQATHTAQIHAYNDQQVRLRGEMEARQRARREQEEKEEFEQQTLAGAGAGAGAEAEQTDGIEMQTLIDEEVRNKNKDATTTPTTEAAISTNAATATATAEATAESSKQGPPAGTTIPIENIESDDVKRLVSMIGCEGERCSEQQRKSES
tara:strand:- start:775 stop:1512 length:738 start_codon:yes stop_codon:yes gene_type:complete